MEEEFQELKKRVVSLERENSKLRKSLKDIMLHVGMIKPISKNSIESTAKENTSTQPSIQTKKKRPKKRTYKIKSNAENDANIPQYSKSYADKKVFEGAVIEAYNKLEGVCDGKVNTLKIKAFLTTNFGLDVQNGWIQSLGKEGLKDFYLKKINGERCVLKK
eukprot:snap_masked-scaffold_37-processed-gene-0.24-mRNA-1 protein AED:1.00 eAED:1.00 QI:0/-1/0/0/-1/1/1/0/161